MMATSAPDGALMAWSDLHVGYAKSRELVADLRPASPEDWLIVAGDVAERIADVEWALRTLAARFARVIWTPGNHELWTHPSDPVTLRGEERYQELVTRLRGLGVVTPEDPYPVWEGAGGPVTIAPLFLLYDYSFLAPGTSTTAESLARAYQTGVVCADEQFLHPDPHPSRQDWCAARLEQTRHRLDALPADRQTVLVNHFPLVRQPTDVLRHPEFAQWCGTVRTADWHRRYRARAVVYGHLHIPRTLTYDGVPFIEVSLAYPREWPFFGGPRGPRQVLPAPEAP
jgi:3',5'-cyclic AMP phosphodiesterase CpdA